MLWPVLLTITIFVIKKPNPGALMQGKPKAFSGRLPGNGKVSRNKVSDNRYHYGLEISSRNSAYMRLVNTTLTGAANQPEIKPAKSPMV